MKRVLLMTLVGLATVTNLAAAGVADDARFALHRKFYTTKFSTICTSFSPNGTNTPCNNFVTTAPILNYSLVYVVVGHGPQVGINGASYGIDYSHTPTVGIGVTSWILCADALEFRNDGGFGEYPAPKGGNRVTWVTCQTQNVDGFGTQAVIGALNTYSYSPDQLSITPNNNLVGGPELAIESCDGGTTQLLEVFPPFAHYSLMGRVDFGGGAGLNPCLIVPTRKTTWGKIKADYSQ